MKNYLILASALALGVATAPAFAEDYGTAAGSADAGSGYSTANVLITAGTAVVAAGIIGGIVAAVADNGGNASSGTTPSSGTSTGTATH